MISNFIPVNISMRSNGWFDRLMGNLTVYALKNCDTCKKALKWLSAENISHNVHEIRSDGVDKSFIEPIVETLGWEIALNRRSTTRRGLDDADKNNIDNAKAVELILANPTLMKRPVFVSGSNMVCGFDAKAQDQLKALL